MEIPFVLVHCCSCGMPFQITQDKYERLLKCHNTFYCPSGHEQYFAGPAEEDRLRKALARCKAEIASLKHRRRVRSKG